MTDEEIIEAGKRDSIALSNPPRPIAARDVRPGDFIFDSGSRGWRSTWVRVIAVREEEKTVIIETVC